MPGMPPYYVYDFKLQAMDCFAHGGAYATVKLDFNSDFTLFCWAKLKSRTFRCLFVYFAYFRAGSLADIGRCLLRLVCSLLVRSCMGGQYFLFMSSRMLKSCVRSSQLIFGLLGWSRIGSRNSACSRLNCGSLC